MAAGLNLQPGPVARRVLLAGATGLVGRALAAQLLEDAGCSALHLLLRRAGALPAASAHAKVHEQVVADLLQPSVAMPAVDDVYIGLGTTIKAAGSQAAFRAVDLDMVVAVARSARRAGAERLAVVSALGADAASSVFYNRVKGEMEAAVAQLGYRSVVIVRPSLLAGDRAATGQPPRTGERIALALTRPLGPLLPARLRPIEAATVARAMRRALDQAAPGVSVLESARLQVLGA